MKISRFFGIFFSYLSSIDLYDLFAFLCISVYFYTACQHIHKSQCLCGDPLLFVRVRNHFDILSLNTVTFMYITVKRIPIVYLRLHNVLTRVQNHFDILDT